MESEAPTRTHQPQVAVLDIQMPGMTGIELTRVIRWERLPVGVLILTAIDDDPYVQAVLQAGANGYVLTTADAQDLIDAVKAVHEGRSVLDPAIAKRLLARVARPRGEAETAGASLTERECARPLPPTTSAPAPNMASLSARASTWCSWPTP